MRLKLARVGGIALVTLILGWVVIGVWPVISGPRIVASIETPDGHELYLVQQWNGEPFRTTFVHRDPEGDWYAYYFNHEDRLWWRGEMRLDANRKIAEVYRRGILVIEFDWSQRNYWVSINNGRMHQRNYSHELPDDWTPHKSVVR